MNPINLIDGQIQHSNLFLHMPIFDTIHYLGHLEGKVRQYRAVHEDQPCQILALNVIRKDEDFLWQAIEDLIKRSVQNAALGVHGVYTFDLLTIDIYKESNKFNHNELTTMLMNVARKLKPGEQRLLKYSTVYGLLQKKIHEDWGKMLFQTSVDVFKDQPVFLDLLVKQLIKNFEFAYDPGILLLNDLSQHPLFEPDNPTQMERLQKLLAKQIPKSIDFPPEVYIQDKNGVRELLSNSIIQG